MRSFFLSLVFAVLCSGDALAGWGAGASCSRNDGYCCVNNEVVCNAGCGCEGGSSVFAGEPAISPQLFANSSDRDDGIVLCQSAGVGASIFAVVRFDWNNRTVGSYLVTVGSLDSTSDEHYSASGDLDPLSLIFSEGTLSASSWTMENPCPNHPSSCGGEVQDAWARGTLQLRGISYALNCKKRAL